MPFYLNKPTFPFKLILQPLSKSNLTKSKLSLSADQCNADHPC